MPKRKVPQEFEVQIEKDPKNPDAYKTAEWTVNKRHPYWESLFWCRKQIIEAEDQFILTGNTEYLRKAEIYNYNKRKLIYEGTSLITSKPPHKGIQSETFELKIWPPKPTIEDLLVASEVQDKQIEEIQQKNKEIIRKRIVKRRKISPVGSSDQEVQILESPPKQTQHQKLKQSNKTPPEIGTRKNLVNYQTLTQNQQQRYQNPNQPYESSFLILKGSLLNIINNPELEEPEITFHQPQLTQIELDSHSENY